ncbi:hypothetical protein Plhal304r1_c010g0040041 [Plasmopara halstedii]
MNFIHYQVIQNNSKLNMCQTWVDHDLQNHMHSVFRHSAIPVCNKVVYLLFFEKNDGKRS